MKFFRSKLFVALTSFFLGMLTSWAWISRGVHFEVTSHETQPTDPMQAYMHQMEKMMEDSRQLVPGLPMDDSALSMGIGDLVEKDDEYLIEVPIQGADQPSLNLQLERGRLTIEGDVVTSQSGATMRSHFQRSFMVPPDVDADKVQMDRKDGGVVIHLPKKK